MTTRRTRNIALDILSSACFVTGGIIIGWLLWASPWAHDTTSSNTDVTLPGGASVSSIVQTQTDCKTLVNSGQVLTVANLRTCQSSAITATWTCPDNSTVLGVPVDDTYWILVQGRPAVKGSSDPPDLSAACP